MLFTIPELIRKKRDGLELTAEEIQFFIQSLVTHNIDDAQIGAMLMAMYLNKQTLKETINLTRAMANSGEVLNFPDYSRDVLVDKHSTGGVGDKVSIVLVPALAACGVKVPMISGRSLGYTGGTLDKLESIPGFQVHLNAEQMNECLSKAGCFICGATSSVAPADGILYKIRDLTATVESADLIAASILSKKASAGVGTLALDVKFGKGALFPTESEALKMADLLRQVGRHLDMNILVVVSQMDAPLGKFVGNALEIIESVMCLRNEVRNVVSDQVKLLGGVILKSKGMAETVPEGERMIELVLENSAALECFSRMLLFQGVSEEHARSLTSGEYWSVLPRASHITRIRSPQKGVVAGIDARHVAKACWLMGGGRVTAESRIDYTVGVVLMKSVGDKVEEDECYIEVHHSTEPLQEEVETLLRSSLTVRGDDVKFKAKLKTRIM